MKITLSLNCGGNKALWLEFSVAKIFILLAMVEMNAREMQPVGWINLGIVFYERMLEVTCNERCNA